MLRFIWLTVLAWLIWRWLDRWLAGRNLPPAAGRETGRFAPPPAEPLVRCDRCGVRVPASQLAAVRGNCRQCTPL
jgi:hypothetical protein